MRRILVTNDDGYQSKGIACLVKILKQFGEVTVVAPKQHQSGMSMAVSLGWKPIAVKDLGVTDGVRWIYVDGTPASAAKYAIDIVFKGNLPDLVVSGVNHGSNASTAMWYSGTIGAAREAALFDIPAVAVSLDNMHRDADFSAVEALFPDILRTLLDNFPKGKSLVYNVNFPDISASEIKGVRICRQGVERWIDEFVTPEQLDMDIKVELEEGETVYFMAGDVIPDPGNSELTDNYANEHGYIAITPQSMDNTDIDEFNRLSQLDIFG